MLRNLMDRVGTGHDASWVCLSCWSASYGHNSIVVTTAPVSVASHIVSENIAQGSIVNRYRLSRIRLTICLVHLHHNKELSPWLPGNYYYTLLHALARMILIVFQLRPVSQPLLHLQCVVHLGPLGSARPHPSRHDPHFLPLQLYLAAPPSQGRSPTLLRHRLDLQPPWGQASRLQLESAVPGAPTTIRSTTEQCRLLRQQQQQQLQRARWRYCSWLLWWSKERCRDADAAERVQQHRLCATGWPTARKDELLVNLVVTRDRA